jgi:hypothetical protein
MDIFLAFLPWKILWNVQINKREKLGALIAMSAGVLCVTPFRLAPIPLTNAFLSAGIISFVKISTLYAISTPDTGKSLS